MFLLKRISDHCVFIEGTDGRLVVSGNFIPNTTIIKQEDSIIVVDPGCSRKNIRDIVNTIKSFLMTEITQIKIINTHWHLDHTANNGLLVQMLYAELGATAPSINIVLSEKIAAGLRNYRSNMNNTIALFFEYFDIPSLMRCLGLGLYRLPLEGLFRALKDIIKNITLGVFLSYYGKVNVGLPYIRNDLVSTEQLCVFPIPGHTDDSLAYYFKEEGILCVGDLDWYVNPNSENGNLVALNNSIRAMIDLVNSENVKVFIPGHGGAIQGRQKIIDHLVSYINKQNELFAHASKIISERNSWSYNGLMRQINEDRFLKDIFARANYPRRPSLIDFFVLKVLEELGYIYSLEQQRFMRNI